MLKLLIANAATDYSKADPPPLRRFYSIGAALSATLHQQMADTFGLAVFEVSALCTKDLTTLCSRNPQSSISLL